MRENIHPKYETATITCGCGNSFETRSTRPQMRIAVRSRSQRIVVRSERLPVHLYGGWVSKTPFVRGLTVVWDSLGVGMKALMFSAEVAEQGEEAEEQAGLDKPVQWAPVALMLLVAVGVFFLLPLGVAGLLELAVPDSIVIHLFEAAVRLALLVGYVWAVGYV